MLLKLKLATSGFVSSYEIEEIRLIGPKKDNEEEDEEDYEIDEEDSEKQEEMPDKENG
jgi:hypothetical protein